MTNQVAPVITIDGPTASGKGTIAQRVAHQLGWHYLDSGALYRLVGVQCSHIGLFAHGFPAENSPNFHEIVVQANRLNARFDADRVYLNDQDVSLEIRAEQAGDWASKVAAIPRVRAALVERQRSFRKMPGLVGDGRDMGTVIFPDAQLKIFLTASAVSRAQRRYKQLIEKGFSANLEGLLKDLQERDERDSTRSSAPLKPADNAVLIDSTALDVEETVAAVLFHYRVHYDENRLF
jgi:CMP/dCMP kinase